MHTLSIPKWLHSLGRDDFTKHLKDVLTDDHPGLMYGSSFILTSASLIGSFVVANDVPSSQTGLASAPPSPPRPPHRARSHTLPFLVAYRTFISIQSFFLPLALLFRFPFLLSFPSYRTYSCKPISLSFQARSSRNQSGPA